MCRFAGRLETLPARLIELPTAHRGGQTGQHEQLGQGQRLNDGQRLVHLARQQAHGRQEADDFFSGSASVLSARNSFSSASINASAILSAWR